MSKTVSIKKIEANRQNGLKSTGPKTAEGKVISSRNSLKHGLLAREVVIDSGDGMESREEFEALLAAYQEQYQPVDLEEEELVEVMALSRWRWARAIRCEQGEIRTRADDARGQQQRDSMRRIGTEKAFAHVMNQTENVFETSSAGIDFLCSILQDVRSEVVANRDLSEEQLTRIVDNFGRDSHFSLHCMGCSATAARRARRDGTLKAETAFPQLSDADRIAAITGAVRREEKRLAELRNAVIDKEALKIEARLKSLSLPAKDEMDRLMRYETMYERQYYRARDRLERLQRLRQGEAVPPPLTVHVASGK